MEKLIELLNEYGNERYDHWGDYQTFMDFSDRDIYWYLSKKFGFIKWLVENDKIDISKIKCGYIYNDTEEDKVKNVIMNLSISDTPIEDLILYLN